MAKKVVPVSPGKKKPPSGRVYSTYDQEYQARPEQVAKRVTRNGDRRKALADGRVSKGDKKDVHHPAGAAKGGKTRVISAKANRSMK
jgi:ribosomal protein L24